MCAACWGASCGEGLHHSTWICLHTADTSRSCKELTAGLLHVMVYQRANDRDVNRMAAGVDFDAVRFQLTAGGTGIVDRLAAMLCAPDGACMHALATLCEFIPNLHVCQILHQRRVRVIPRVWTIFSPTAETQTRVLAVYALSNLAGTVNTGPCPACAHSTAKLGGLLKKAPEVCVHNPRMAVSLQAEALSVVFDMLESSNVADIAASVALLNNLCYKVDDARDRVGQQQQQLLCACVCLDVCVVVSVCVCVFICGNCLPCVMNPRPRQRPKSVGQTTSRLDCSFLWRMIFWPSSCRGRHAMVPSTFISALTGTSRRLIAH